MLVVDDEPLVRDVIAAELQDAGFDVLTAGGGAEAIDLLQGDARVDALVTASPCPASTALR